MDPLYLITVFSVLVWSDCSACILASICSCACIIGLVYLLYLPLVSLSKQQLDSRGEEELDDQEKEEDTPLVALAPDVSIPEEQPSTSTDVSAESPFQCLDEVRIIHLVNWSSFL